MSVIQVPDELQRVIDRQVAEGRAISPAEFLREAVMRLVDATDAELDAIQQVVEGGSADIDAGRYTVVATAADERRLHDSITARLQSQFATDRQLGYRLTEGAERQIDALLLDSAHRHGVEAAGRYGELILTAMSALGEKPDLNGSVAVPRLGGIRAYPMRLARRRVEPARRVAVPRHLVVYRVAPDGVVEVLGLVHDRMVLSRAAQRIVRSLDER